MKPISRHDPLPMSVRERASLLAPVAGIKVRDLIEWLEVELGCTDALDHWCPRAKGVESHAVAPHTIYHLCPGNIAEAGLQSILLGLLLGSHNVAKLPGDPHVRAALRDFAEKLPAPLHTRLVLRTTFRPKEMAKAEAVIAYGGDETVAALRAYLRPGQIFLPYGHRVSLLWLGQMRATDKNFRALAAAAARDIVACDQLGCLSPQAIYLAPESDPVAFGAALAEALDRSISRQPAKLSLPEAAAIRHARQAVRIAGGEVLESATDLRWTVLLDPRPAFRDGFAHRTIPVRVASPDQLKVALRPFAGKVSTVGLRAPFSPDDEALALALGAERLCPVGQCQQPSLFRHHDGRPRLADLVKWVDREAIQPR